MLKSISSRLSGYAATALIAMGLSFGLVQNSEAQIPNGYAASTVSVGDVSRYSVYYDWTSHAGNSDWQPSAGDQARALSFENKYMDIFDTTNGGLETPENNQNPGGLPYGQELFASDSSLRASFGDFVLMNNRSFTSYFSFHNNGGNALTFFVTGDKSKLDFVTNPLTTNNGQYGSAYEGITKSLAVEIDFQPNDPVNSNGYYGDYSDAGGVQLGPHVALNFNGKSDRAADLGGDDSAGRLAVNELPAGIANSLTSNPTDDSLYHVLVKYNGNDVGGSRTLKV